MIAKTGWLGDQKMLQEINTIVYASDLGNDSRPGFRVALKLAQLAKAKLTFLHVLEPLSPMANKMLKSWISEDLLKKTDEESVKKMANEILNRLEQFCKEELEENGLFDKGLLNIDVKIGRPETTIIKVAEDLKADHIVMGTRPHGVVDQALLGSTANYVIHHSNCPVTVVPLRQEH